MLVIDELHAGYGQTQVLRGVDLTVAPGEIVALLGRNGSGRTTTARAIMGVVCAQGRIVWRGLNLLGLSTCDIARTGIAYVPEDRGIFPMLTVAENILLGGALRAKRPWDRIQWLLQRPVGDQRSFSEQPWWPIGAGLENRMNQPAGVLSGGEQQMLALCRALAGEPDLLVLDEPTEGLSPKATLQVSQVLRTVQSLGVSVLLIEQKLTVAQEVADRCAVMVQGRIVRAGPTATVLAELESAWIA